MKLKVKIILPLVVALFTANVFADRKMESLNGAWDFSLNGDEFRTVEVPHDWAIAGPFDPRAENGSTGKLPWKGKGVYRRTLILHEKPQGRIFLDFDGVMARATVFVNGQPCGKGEYGYLGFRADATPYLISGTNTIEVQADTTALASRWYPGGGIYRSVRLVRTDGVFFPDEMLRIETTDVLTDIAKIKIMGSIANRLPSTARGLIKAKIKDPNGTIVAADEGSICVDPFDGCGFELGLKVRTPRLWEMKANAALYNLEITIEGQGFSDLLMRRIGFREFKFDPNNGFFLNGKRVQLKGVDLHSDLGPLGMAFNRDAAHRQLSIMLDMGANALRTSHNPPAPEVLDLCDELGIFVWDEAFDKWNATSGRGDEPLEEFVPRQLKRLVQRDRNHPCVFVWSIGNEISPGQATPPGQEHWAGAPSLGTSTERCAIFRKAVREEDDTRPVAIGSCFPEAGQRGDYDFLDLTGWNYRGMYDKMRTRRPDKPLLYSESASALSEWGYYADCLPTNKTDFAVADNRVDSYDLNAADWSDIPDREFFRMERDRFCAGEFVWTGIDYLGEPTPYASNGESASRSSYFGICDLCVLPKDRYWLYRSHWNREVFTLHIVPGHWNFPKKIGTPIPVFVYTGADEVELFVNGRTLGRRRKNASATMDGSYYAVMPRYRLMWTDVTYEPGEVRAVAYDSDGKVIGEKRICTAGAAARIVLEPERRYGELCVVKVTLADEDGYFVPNDDRRIAFSAEGCEILAVGNSDPRGYDSFKDTASHPLKFGRAAVYLRIRKNSPAILTASTEGLRAASIAF